MNDYFSITIQGYIFLIILQTVLWAWQNKTKDASTADVGWSLGMSLLAAWYAINLDGYWLRKGLAFTPLLIWSLRLSYHLLRRISHEKREDSRYAQFRTEWGSKASRNFFLIYQLQPVFNVLLTVPFFIIFLNPDPEIKPIELLALVVWVLGLAGEMIADEQLRAFKNNPANKGKICQSGLWNYSRHPNFFFEWVMWVSYFLFAIGSPHGMWAAVAPCLMLFLLLKVTGIPLMEQRALKNKGEAFKEYMRTTSFFVPLPKKTGGK